MAKKKIEKKVQQKVLFVFLASCMALGLAYTISKVAFDEMLKTVDNIAKPNDKLRFVNKISRDVLLLDQIQRSDFLLTGSQLTGNHPSSADSSYSDFTQDSDLIFSNIDSLKMQYKSNRLQTLRIDSISNLLRERNKLFIAYVQVRNSLIDNSNFRNQIQNIDKLISTAPKNENTIITTQKATRRTQTTSPSGTHTSDEINEEKDDRSFLAKLFGAKKKSPEIVKKVPQEVERVIHEEMTINVDTLNEDLKGTTKNKINNAIRYLERRQQLQSSTFIDREKELAVASNLLINKIISILNEVEREAKIQVEADTQNAQMVVNKSVSKISYILLFSFIIISFLIYFILDDIRKARTNRLALEKAKEEAEYHTAAKQRFLSNMSHELRTPLQSIIGYAEQLKKSNIDNKKVEIISQASEHLLQIVNEILDYNRIISGRFVFQQKTVSISELVTEVVRTMKQHADKKDITLELNQEITGTGYVLGDPFRIKQILYNLISNAIKFTNEGGIVVNAKATEEDERTTVSFTITDTGQGIADQDIDHIFDEFELGKNHNSGENFGSGLGLSIVKSLVEEMDGIITLTSNIDQGSSFSVHLFLLSSVKAEPTLLIGPHKISMEPVKTVWVVDDDSFILELCGTILNKNKIRFKLFSTPTLLLNEPFDADLSHILMDLRMPGLSGNELRHIVKHRLSKPVTIIAFTAQALPEEQSKILSEGFEAILIKPFREAELLSVLGFSPLEKNNSTSSVHFNLGTLGYIYEDPKELSKIIDLFIKDTLEDLSKLKTAIRHESTIDAEILFHRLAGRSAQLGQEKVAFNLRKCEIDARNGEIPTQLEYAKIEKQLVSFINFLKKGNMEISA